MPNDALTLRAEVRRLFAPPPRLTVTEWANKHRRLSSESSAEPGVYRSSRAPYQAGIMNTFNDPKIETVVVQSAAQIGKSIVIENCLGYVIAMDQGPVLIVHPTAQMAEAFSKDRFAVMLRDTPALGGLVAEPRTKDSANTLLHKVFPGGSVTLVGANSPSGLAARSIRFAFFDEVDRFPTSAGTEGDPVTLGIKRTTTFPNRKIIMTSTPTLKGLSRIEHAFLAGDQRYYHVPCPDCGEHQALRWKNLRWDEGQPATAHYVCEHCGVLIEEKHKSKMLQAGKWIASAPFNGTASFHLSELYSPWVTWATMATNFVQATHGGSEMLQAFINTSLGESWEDQGDAVEPTGLMSRLEDYDRDTIEPLAITAGCDIQKDRIEVSVVAWGAGEEAWLLEHAVLPGDTARPEVWADLHELIAEHSPSAVAVDSGYNATAVYAFVERRRFAFAIKGISGFDKPVVEDARKRAGRLRNRRRVGGSPVQLIGVDAAKVIIHSRLRIMQPGPGYIHFSEAAGCDDEYFAQLTAEKLVVKHRMGRASQEWVQQRPRNETLDAFVYALAALRLSGALERGIVQKANATLSPEEQQQRHGVRRIGRIVGPGRFQSF
jgi:phage terminase large subunit GpA-like protein